MKVFCINGDGWECDVKFLWLKWRRETKGPSYGDILTVVGGNWDEGVYWYSLLEWPNGPWRADCFIPISDNEEELANELAEVQKLKNQ